MALSLDDRLISRDPVVVEVATTGTKALEEKKQLKLKVAKVVKHQEKK